MPSGIYAIQNRNNGKVYIGSAIDFRKRKNVHFCLLRKGKHHSSHLQKAWDKYGESAFEFRPLFICAPKDLEIYEQRTVDGFKASDRRHGYNGRPVAASQLGMKHSEATKEKIRKKRALRVYTVEHRAALSRSHKGIKVPPGFGEAVSLRKRGTKHTPEAKAKMSVWQIGKKHSLEWRENRSSAKLNAQKVRDIKPLYATGGQSQKSIASRFGIDQSTVSYIISGKRWAVVD